MRKQNSDQRVRFAAFELDLESGELRCSGVRLPVQGRPLQVLAVLLRAPGQLVTTEQLREELWPSDTFVDFEHGVRNAVARLRAVLGDSADKPRFIETLPRRGYRFIGTMAEPPAQPVAETIQPVPAAQTVSPAGSSPPAVPRRHGLRIILIALCSLVPLAGAGTWLYVHLRGSPGDVPIRSLAVLPLEDLSGDRTQDYFADGVTDELITALARINSVQVISRTSVMQYKGVHNKPLPQIARELGVDAVLEGTLVHSGDRVRVTAQLIEARTDRHLWADRYERSSRDILLLENEISRTIAQQLRGKLNPHEESRFRAQPIAPAAHDAYLQGLNLWYRRTPAALEQAVRYFTEAIEKDPGHAEIYAARASAYIVLGSGAMEAIPPMDALSRVKEDAEKALQLDETSSQAHAVRAAILSMYEWDRQGAEMELLRAIELSPSNATAHYWYGQVLCNLGRFEECLTETARAHALEPGYLAVAVEMGCMLYEARRYDEASAPIQKVLESTPDFAVGRRCLGQIYEAKRMYREAIAELTKGVELSGGAPLYVAGLGHAYAVSGHTAEARKALQTLDELATRRYVSGFQRALICAGLGETDRALEWLQRAFQEHSSGMGKLKVDPRLDPLRGDPRFTDLLRRVGLAP